MLEKIKKHKGGLLVFLFISLSCIIIAFSYRLEANDELWNFQNIYKMFNGYEIYQDANVIITPIFYWIGEGIFHLLGANFLVFRIYNILIYSLMIALIYIILKKVKIHKRNAFLYALIIHYILYILLGGGANYNLLAFVWVLLGILCSIQFLENKKYNAINAFITYLILFTKQNIGVYYFIGSMIIQLLLMKDKKEAIIRILKQGIYITILSLGTFGIFWLKGTLPDFINYAFLGMGEFSEKNISLNFYSAIYLAICMIIFVGGIILRKYIKDEEEKRNLTILFCIAIPMLMVAYPIFNEYHILLGMIPFIMALFYLVDISIVKHFASKKVINLVLGVILLLFVAIEIKSGISMISYSIFEKDRKDPYYGVIVEEEMQEKIEKVNKYIEEQDEKVIILSSDAALYQVPKKRNNGAMDLPFLGNMGYHGQEAMIQKIHEKIGYKILIKEPIYWQESEKIIQEIKEHYEKIGEIEEFQIYEIK